MTAQIGADGLEVFGDPLPDVLAAVAAAPPEPGGEWVHLARLGFRTTQRLRISDLPNGGAVMATWPAELKGQAEQLYGRGLAVSLVAAALDRGWSVEASPHLAFHTARPSRRLYMRPHIDARVYAGQWQESDALRRVGNHSREEVERELWPWLKLRGYADDRDDNELRRFLDECLRQRPAHMRPGLRLRRVWSGDEISALGSALPDSMRREFNALFAVAEELRLGDMLTTAPTGARAPVKASAGPVVRVVSRESIPERVRHEVWRRDQGRCVDCGSRERLEFDHVIPLSKGGSNTARNLELRCESCNRKKGARI